jgi:hypothetical protein
MELGNIDMRHGDAWKHGNMETWKHGNMETWRHENMEIWKHGDMETWRHGVMDIETRIKYWGFSNILGKNQTENRSPGGFFLFVYHLLLVQTEVCRFYVC